VDLEGARSRGKAIGDEPVVSRQVGAFFSRQLKALSP
jgi:hypothetical protein